MAAFSVGIIRVSARVRARTRIRVSVRARVRVRVRVRLWFKVGPPGPVEYIPGVCVCVCVCVACACGVAWVGARAFWRAKVIRDVFFFFFLLLFVIFAFVSLVLLFFFMGVLFLSFCCLLWGRVQISTNHVRFVLFFCF